MKTPAIPQNEAERIAVLRNLLILDTAPEERFEVITAYAQARFHTEIAVVSLVDSDRQWFKSICGLDARETPRDISFCGHAILNNSVMVVANALKDERFCDNPLVMGPPHIRFYAGAPLVLSTGHIVGTLCIIDSKPRNLQQEEEEHLKVLAHVVAMELEKHGRFDNCKDHCLYGHLPMACPYKDTKKPIPGLPRVDHDENAVPVFDRAKALERLGGFEEFLDEVIASAIADANSDFEHLKLAIATLSKDDATLRAHSIKGAAAAAGATALSTIAAEIEVYAKLGDFPSAESILGELAAQIERFKLAVEIHAK